MGRNDLCFCGSGIKIKKCHPDINEKSIIASLFKKYSEFDKLCLQANTPCAEGCSKCCHDYFYVSEVEYFGIAYYVKARGLDQSKIKEKARVILQEIEEKHPQEAKILRTTMSVQKTVDFSNEEFDDNRIRALMHDCPFLDEEKKTCLVYPVRPFICRGYGSHQFFGGCEKCKKHDMCNSEIFPSLLTENVDIFRLHEESSFYVRPYPLAEWILFRGFDNSPKFIKSINEGIDHYIQFALFANGLRNNSEILS